MTTDTAVQAPNPFDTADYYDARESERLQYEAPWDAIEEYLETWMERGCDVEAVIRERGEITVRALDRMTLTPEWIAALAARLLDHAHDGFTEEFGDPDGGDDGLSDKIHGRYAPMMIDLLTKFYQHADVWPCVQVAERTYDTDEILAMARAERPDWFEK
jgi:hypothetical protein